MGPLLCKGGTITVADASPLNINSSAINIGDTNADAATIAADLTVTGDVQGGAPLIFQGATDNANTTTLALVDPTTVNVIALPNQSGTIILDGDIDLQSAYDGGNSIVTTALRPLDISGAGEINLGATSNDINIATATSGTVDITGADQVDITAGAGGINLDGTTNLNGNTINIGDANSDAIDLTGNTNINGGSLNITSNTTLEDATTLDVNSNTINLGDDNTDDITLTGNTNITGGSVNIDVNTTIEDATALTINSNTINIGDDNDDAVDITGVTNINGGTLTIASQVAITGEVQNQNALIFEGNSQDASETTLAIEDPTADRLIFLPNLDGNYRSRRGHRPAKRL